MNKFEEKQWLSVDDVANLLQVKRPCAKRKMREMAECVNLGSEKYQILMVSASAFAAWMRNRRIVTQFDTRGYNNDGELYKRAGKNPTVV